MWKDVEQNDKYEVHSSGIVRRKDSGHVLKGCITSGYRSVKLTFEQSKQKRFYVHRLVAQHFLPRPEKQDQTQVNHKNGDKLDNRVENLEWVSPRENNLHYYRKIQAKKKDERRRNSKAVPVVQYDLLGNKIAEYLSMSKAKEGSGISLIQISRCVHGEIENASGYIFKRK